MATPEDTTRDPRLLAALRHAPDHDAAPPAALDRAILDAAHQSAQRRPEPGVWHRLSRAVQEALQVLTRPAAGAALASLVLATTIVLIWRDGPPPEADREAPPMRAESRVADNVASAAAASPAAPMTAKDSDQRAMPQAKKAAAAAMPAREQQAPAKAPAAAANAGPAQRTATKATDAAEAVEATKREPAVAAAPVPAPALTAAAPPAPGAAATASELRGDARAARPLLAARSREASVGTPPPELLRAIAEPGALQQALRELAQRAESRDAWSGGWAPVALQPALGDALLRSTDGTLIGRLRIEDGALVWIGAGGATKLVLDPAALASLRGALASAETAPPR